MEQKKYNILGLMSGSSLDGLDIAWCSFSYSEHEPIQWKIKAAKTYEYNPKWVLRLEKLPEQTALIFAKTHTYLGHYMGEFINQFLAETQADIDFIASHGHTIFHYPNQTMTSQIGDGAAIAAKTGLPVIADFRTHDIALGGEGTPLAPTVDRYLFSEYDFLLNLGGIANLTHQTDGKHTAFDISPCNQILNALSQLLGFPYDDNGQLAKNGQLDEALAQLLHSYPYFSKPQPKSLDNQYIQRTFLPKVLKYKGKVEDKLHTCCVVFAQQIAQHIHTFPISDTSKLLITGGGAYNDFLIECIKTYASPKVSFHLPDTNIIEYKEALLMALLGLLRVENKINCFSEITGATTDSIGGAIYQGIKKHI